MKVDSDTTIRVTLTSDEVRQAVLDWVRRNYRGASPAPVSMVAAEEAARLVLQGVDFQFETEGEFEDQVTKTDAWPGETTLLFSVQQPKPGPPAAKRPAGKRSRPRAAPAAPPADPRSAPLNEGRCGSHHEGTEDFRGSDY